MAQICHCHSPAGSMTAANRTAQLPESLSCHSKFIAYLEAPQNTNNSFWYALERKKTPYTKPPPIKLDKGHSVFLTLPAVHQKSSCWAATEHTASLRVPQRQSHKRRQQHIPAAPLRGHETRHAACIPAGLQCPSTSKSSSVQVPSTAKIHTAKPSPHCTAQLCCWS